MKTTDTHSNAAIAKIVSERLTNARALCGLNLVEASERMGYTNASGLYKLENNPPSIQLWAIVKAARVYEVSTDYLLGLTDDWEADERLLERQGAHWVYAAMESARKRDTEVMAKLQAQIIDVVRHAKPLANNAIAAAFEDEQIRNGATEGVREFHRERRRTHISMSAQSAKALRNLLIKSGMFNDNCREQLVIDVVAAARVEA